MYSIVHFESRDNIQKRETKPSAKLRSTTNQHMDSHEKPRGLTSFRCSSCDLVLGNCSDADVSKTCGDGNCPVVDWLVFLHCHGLNTKVGGWLILGTLST